MESRHKRDVVGRSFISGSLAVSQEQSPEAIAITWARGREST